MERFDLKIWYSGLGTGISMTHAAWAVPWYPWGITGQRITGQSCPDWLKMTSSRTSKLNNGGLSRFWTIKIGRKGSDKPVLPGYLSKILDVVNKYSGRTGLTDHFLLISYFQNLLKSPRLGFEVCDDVIFSQLENDCPVFFCPVIPHPKSIQK